MTDIGELSDREREILYLVATGASNKEIASQLYISTNTVKVHLKNIFTKIGVASRTEAAMYAVQAGLVDPSRSPQPLVQESLAEEPQGGQDGFALTGENAIQPRRPARMWIGVAVFIGLVGLALGLFWIFRPDSTSAQPTGTVPLAASLPRWEALAPLPTARSGLAAAAYGNQIYTFAGEAADGITGAVVRYDPEVDQWTALKAKPIPVKDVQAALIAGRFYIPGGQLQDGSVTDALEIYDPASGNWMVGQPLPSPRSAYALASFEGKLYVFGGWDGSAVKDSVYTYDPDLDEWTERTPLPTARAHAGAAAALDKIYVMGGFDGTNNLAINEVYQPDLDQAGQNPWTIGAPLPAPRAAMGSASVADIIHVIGGQYEGSFASLGYVPETDSWQPVEEFEGIGSHLAVAPLGEFLYVIGGKDQVGPQDSTLRYRAIYTVSIPVIINSP